MPLWAYGAAGALLAGALAGWTVRDWKADSEALAASDKALEAVKASAQQGLDAAADYARGSAAEQRAAATDRSTIRETYREIKVPADCAVPVAGVRVLEGARDRANAAATGEPVSAVPASGAAADGVH